MQCWRVLVVLGMVFGVWMGPARAQAPETAAAENAVSTQPVFHLTVHAPEPVASFLLTHLELQRFRTLADLDRTELQRLLLQVPADANGLLATLGYMSPEVTARLADAEQATPAQAAPGGNPQPLPEVVVDVTTGPLTLVTAVNVHFSGDIATRPASATQRDTIQEAFSLKPGLPFTQASWDTAKNQALRALTSQRYPAGRISHSLADIDPATHTATLTLELDSGPALRLGDIVVTGTERYDPAMVQRLVRLAGLLPGTDYDLARVLEAQRRVAESGYFESVFVLIEPGSEPERAPVQVKVREVMLQKLVLGVGGSTDNGARISIEHTHHRVPGLQWRAVTGLTLSRNNQSAQTTLTSPVNDAGWRWVLSGLLNRQDDATGVTESQRLRAGQTQDNLAFSRSLFMQYDRARTYTDGQPTEGQASVSANFAWTLRRLDQVLFPESGYSLGLEVGTGMTLEQSRRPYLRNRLRGLSYLPFADDARGRLALRAEAGGVWARQDAQVPSTELFLTGGDNSVRGYALRSLGVKQADGTVAPGRVLLAGSVEWQRPLVLNQQRSAWENTFFIDAGAVSDTAAALRAKVGIGTGVRYRSPVGPLQLDLAYGVATKRLRLHLTVGFRF